LCRLYSLDQVHHQVRKVSATTSASGRAPSYGAMTLVHFGTGPRGATSNTATSTTERRSTRAISATQRGGAISLCCSAAATRPWPLAHTARRSVGQIGNPSGAEEVLSGQAGSAQPLCRTHSQQEATVVTTRLFEEGTTLSSSSRLETSAHLDRNIERGSAPRKNRWE
jgi:hypothetical protein